MDAVVCVLVTGLILWAEYRFATRWSRYYRRLNRAAREDMRNYRPGMSYEEAHRARLKVKEPMP